MIGSRVAIFLFHHFESSQFLLQIFLQLSSSVDARELHSQVDLVEADLVSLLARLFGMTRVHSYKSVHGDSTKIPCLSRDSEWLPNGQLFRG